MMRSWRASSTQEPVVVRRSRKRIPDTVPCPPGRWSFVRVCQVQPTDLNSWPNEFVPPDVDLVVNSRLKIHVTAKVCRSDRVQGFTACAHRSYVNADTRPRESDHPIQSGSQIHPLGKTKEISRRRQIVNHSLAMSPGVDRVRKMLQWYPLMLDQVNVHRWSCRRRPRRRDRRVAHTTVANGTEYSAYLSQLKPWFTVEPQF